jgi:ARG and Rhodanese-Phosphatase-superfamily-associated Protein domain
MLARPLQLLRKIILETNMEILNNTLQSVSFGESQSHLNLSIIPLLRDSSETPDYITLDEALNTGNAQIMEVSDTGNVPELLFENKGDIAILVLDGEELVGAKQNRILNLTILVPARSSITVPVSCVEAGRWAHTSENFSSEQRTYFAEGRAKKAAHITESLQYSGSRHSRQGEVWADIAMKSDRLNSHSNTDAMASMYQDHSGLLTDFSNAFDTARSQCGAIFSINGNIRGIELFDYPDTFQKLSEKLIRSYALDAIDSQELDSTEIDLSDPMQLVAGIKEAETKSFEAIGEGDDIRLIHNALTGGALIARERLIHLCAFSLRSGNRRQRDSSDSRLRRASSRRKHYQYH